MEQLEQERNFHLDLSYCNLQLANIQDRNFERASFFRSRLDGAYANRAKLSHVNLRYSGAIALNGRKLELVGAQMVQADFLGASLPEAKICGEGVDASGAGFQFAYLEEADLSGANFISADFHGCIRMDGIMAKGTIFADTDFSSCDISRWAVDQNTIFNTEKWDRAVLRDLGLSAVKNPLVHLCKAMGDSSVLLPNLAERPSNWHKEKMSNDQYIQYRHSSNVGECHHRSQERATYVPPL